MCAPFSVIQTLITAAMLFVSGMIGGVALSIYILLR